MFHLRLLMILALCGLLARPVQAEPVDSLAVKNGEAKNRPVPLWPRIRSIGGGERATGRILAKIFVGSVSSIVFSGALTAVLVHLEKEKHYETEPPIFSGGFINGMMYGPLLGFPVGVSLADPHDSFAFTLMAGYLLSFGVLEIFRYTGDGPVFFTYDSKYAFFAYGTSFVSSLIASEIWRKPPQDRRVSFGVSPALSGGLSASATLRF
ncbi:MAG: hypothetical protein OXI58_07435 [Gemmatimonadota bacterium]|nr:hypothetical protein [Gemmatimonadota bacterium]